MSRIIKLEEDPEDCRTYYVSTDLEDDRIYCTIPGKESNSVYWFICTPSGEPLRRIYAEELSEALLCVTPRE